MQVAKGISAIMLCTQIWLVTKLVVYVVPRQQVTHRSQHRLSEVPNNDFTNVEANERTICRRF